MGGKQRHAPSLVLERIARSRVEEPLCVIGIDEVGTGALAGPIITAAVAFEDDEDKLPIAVRDSKILTHERRKELYIPIIDAAVVTGIGYVTPEEIDKFGMAKAKDMAIIRAYRAAKKRYTGVDGRLVAIVDGRNLKGLREYMGGSAAVFADRGDQKSYSIAAASIIAKVTRDEIMFEVAKEYPEYGFEQHVGYGTKKHFAALKKHGPTKIHRHSFKPLKRLAKEQNGED
jgi:ribonuclease HII